MLALLTEMFHTIIIVVCTFSVFYLKKADAQGTDCFVYKDGIQSYTGTTNVTRTGKICQRWDSQYPHQHRYGSVGEHQNYCRSPDNHTKLWCYTTDRITRWEDCDIPECADDDGISSTIIVAAIVCGTVAVIVIGVVVIVVAKFFFAGASVGAAGAAARK